MFDFWYTISNLFHTYLDDVFLCGVWGSWLDTIKEIGVIGALSQLHQNVLQAHFLDLIKTGF